MPELPEVENARRAIAGWANGHRITDVIINYSKIIKQDSEEFKANLIGEKIHEIKRHGKWLIFALDNRVLLSHLRMEGKYHYFKKDEYLPNRHDLVIFVLDNGYYLIYNDTRRFGVMMLVPEDYLNHLPLKALGQEPFEMKAEELYAKMQASRLTLKEFLLDQSNIAGLGNIYVDEVNYAIGRLYSTPVKTLTLADAHLIIEKSKIILNRAIDLGGSTFSSFTFGNHEKGKFQDEFQIYGRNGQKCYQCGGIIEKTKYKGRGTHYCPKCQGGK